MIDNVLHPGLVLMLVGLVAAVVPRMLRRMVLALGPLAALYAAYVLPVGTQISLPFVQDYTLHLMYVDKLSWIFGFIFSVLAVVCGIYSAHNNNRMEALCSMSYAGGAIGVVMAKDWITFIFFWEALAVTSMYLVWCRHTAESRRAGFRYILIHMLGGNLLLAGIFLSISAGQTEVMNLTAGPHGYAYWLILLGVCVNVAMPPVNAGRRLF